MSVVTNVMVSFCTLEFESPGFLERMRGWFHDKGELNSIAHGFAGPPPYWWGGQKHPECQLWAGAYNHLDLTAVLKHLETVQWEWPELVQVFVREQEAVTFCVYMFDGGRLHVVLPYVPEP